MNQSVRMRVAVAMFATSMVLTPIAAQGESLHRIALPQGVSLELPSNWSVMDQGRVRSVEQYIRLMLRGHGRITGKAGFVATLRSPSGTILAQAAFRFYSDGPANAITQTNIKHVTSDDLNYLDDEFRKGKEAGARKMGAKIWGWQPPRKENVGEFLALVWEHKFRFAHETFDRHDVRVRVYDGPLSFSLMLNYRDGMRAKLRPILDRIARSLARVRDVKRSQVVPSTKKQTLSYGRN